MVSCLHCQAYKKPCRAKVVPPGLTLPKRRQTIVVSDNDDNDDDNAPKAEWSRSKAKAKGKGKGKAKARVVLDSDEEAEAEEREFVTSGSNPKVMLISLKAGALGLNLTVANNVYL